VAQPGGLTLGFVALHLVSYYLASGMSATSKYISIIVSVCIDVCPLAYTNKAIVQTPLLH